MGFYSIYKIIKDMIRTLFGNHALKLIIICIIISLILFTLDKKSVFGANEFSISYSMEGSPYTITVDSELLNYKYIFLYASGSPRDKRGQYDFIATNVAPYSFSEGSLSYNISFRFNEGEERYVYGSSGNLSSEPSNLIISKANAYFQNNSSSYSINITKNNGSYMYGYNYSYSYLSTFDVVINNQNIFATNYYTFINPSLSNSQQQLENLSFNNFIINANSYTQEIENNDGTLFMLFYNRSLSNPQTTEGLYPIKEKGFTKGSIFTDVENSTSNNMVFSYPIFMSGVYFNIGSTYEIRFAKKVYNSEYNTMVYEYLGEPIQFTISSNVTQDYINQLNQQTATSSDNEYTKELQNSINNQTQSIDNINNTITDSTVDNSSIQLPTDNTNDPTQSGVDNIFQTIYNSFTSGTAQDIVFPIPNTNKNITLPANYTYNSLNNNDASWVIDIIQAFYWYIISRYIIVDIMQKIRKIKQGNLDNIENSNIKEDML